MRIVSGWPIAAAAACLLAAGAARAQVSGDLVPTAPGGSSGITAAPAGSYTPPPPIRPGHPISVLVFPFGFAGADAEAGTGATGAGAPGDMAGAGGEAPAMPAPGLTAEQILVAGHLTASVKAGLLASPFFAVATYHPQSALVQRARKDDILRPEQLTDVISATGAVNLDKAKVIAHRLSLQTLLVGTIELKEDAKANSVEVTLETQLINSTTGQVLRAAAVSGAAAGAEGVPMETVEERAAIDAAMKALPALGVQLTPLPGAGEAKQPEPKPGGKGAPRGKMTAEERKAAREAKKAAEEAKKQAEAERRAAEKARKEAERKAREEKNRNPDGGGARIEPLRTPVAGATPPPAVAPRSPRAAAVGRRPGDQADQGQPGAGEMPPPPAPGSVPAYTNQAGQPVPYGYALGEAPTALPARKKGGLRVPPWLGVAGFMAGLSFLF
jgi:hypothetical protein